MMPDSAQQDSLNTTMQFQNQVSQKLIQFEKDAN